MNLLEASEFLLREAGASLHVRDIARRAEEQGLVETACVHALDLFYEGLERSIEQAGSDSAVVRVGEGIYALRQWEEAVGPAPETEAFGLPPKGEAEPFAEPIELEPELELSFERMPAWRPALQQVQALLRQRPATPFYARVQGFLQGLFGWGVLNMLGSIALRFRRGSKVSSGLASALFSWGSAHALVSMATMKRVADDDAMVTNGTIGRKALDQRMNWYRDSVEALSIVGTIVGAVGLLLGVFCRRDSRTRGRGLGMLTQGAFLVTLTGAIRFLREHRESAPQPDDSLDL